MLTHEQKATIEALDGLLIPVLQDMIVEYLGVLTFTFKPGDFRWFIWKSSNITFMPTWGVCSSRKFLGRSMYNVNMEFPPFELKIYQKDDQFVLNGTFIDINTCILKVDPYTQHVYVENC